MKHDYFSKKISLREDEQIILIIHHHVITYWKQILISVGLILGAFFLMFFLVSKGPLGVAFFLAMLLTGFIYGIRELYLWFVNVFIITNHRIIDIDQKALFNKTVSEAGFERISDICYSVKGLLQTILKLGTIRITASGVKLVIKNVYNVSAVNLLMTDLIRQQTGKKIEAKKINQMGEKTKEKITDEFLNQDDLAEYEDYKLEELIEEYKETYGELSLKKLLVDELEEADEQNDEDEESATDVAVEEDDEEADDEVEEDEDDDEDEEVNVKSVQKFKKKKL